MKLLTLLIGLATAQTAVQPPSYIIYYSQSLCLQRSQQMCQAMGCDGIHTIYWWDCNTALNAGTVGPTAVVSGSYAMRIDTGTRFAVTATNLVSNGIQGLNATEQSQLVTQSALMPLMVNPPPNAITSTQQSVAVP